MEHEIFLYPYSKAEAGRRGELDRWEESFRANVSCAREIEAAIRGYSNVDGILQPGAVLNFCIVQRLQLCCYVGICGGICQPTLIFFFDIHTIYPLTSRNCAFP